VSATSKKDKRMKANRRGRQEHTKSQSPIKGSNFENRVRRLLDSAKRKSDGKITYEPKPRITLANGDTRIPDFLLVIARPYVKRHILIECQNRKRSSKPIVEKIQYVRSQHQSQTFIFVYPKRIGSELAKRLDGHGVTLFNLSELKKYLGEEARDVRASWAARMTATQRSRVSSAKTKEMLETRQVAFHSHPDARQQLDDSLEDKGETPPDGLQKAFG
jgi:hypothetical protein